MAIGIRFGVGLVEGVHGMVFGYGCCKSSIRSLNPLESATDSHAWCVCNSSDKIIIK